MQWSWALGALLLLAGWVAALVLAVLAWHATQTPPVVHADLVVRTRPPANELQGLPPLTLHVADTHQLLRIDGAGRIRTQCLQPAQHVIVRTPVLDRDWDYRIPAGHTDEAYRTGGRTVAGATCPETAVRTLTSQMLTVLGSLFRHKQPTFPLVAFPGYLDLYSLGTIRLPDPGDPHMTLKQVLEATTGVMGGIHNGFHWDTVYALRMRMQFFMVHKLDAAGTRWRLWIDRLLLSSPADGTTVAGYRCAFRATDYTEGNLLFGGDSLKMDATTVEFTRQASSVNEWSNVHTLHVGADGVAVLGSSVDPATASTFQQVFPESDPILLQRMYGPFTLSVSSYVCTTQNHPYVDVTVTRVK